MEFDLGQILPHLSIGTVTTLAPTQAPTVTLTGTLTAPLLNIGIPRGPDGQPGANGQPGAQGPAGPQGPQG